MPLPVIWRESAAAELDEIVEFIAGFDDAAADRIEAAALTCAERLPDFPFMHRIGRVPGTREAVIHPNYILVYRVGAALIEVVSVVHARRNYP